MSTHKEIWTTLSKVDCSNHIEKKGNLSYLSWAWAWGIMMDHYPEAQYNVLPEVTYPDGSVECRMEVTVGECRRMCWLPVMDNRNNAVTNPSARAISDTRMRCLVKCLAIGYGLGLYIYAGEDLPQQGPISADQAEVLKTYMAMLEPADADKVHRWLKKQGINAIDEIPEAKYDKVHGVIERAAGKQYETDQKEDAKSAV